MRFPTVKLLDFDPLALEATPHPFAVLTLMDRDAQETRGQPAERLQRKVARYRALVRQGYAAQDRRILLHLMDHVLRLDAELAARAFDQMRQVESEAFFDFTSIDDLTAWLRAAGSCPSGVTRSRIKPSGCSHMIA
ncbi:hypothetical protein [Candidatus Chloroploca sp. Khr17]|uniref:hypothetical protein n=1 Tax=Candidatus Chloroploca sp. Khr17 TaxID=2496869 RepID=UPI00101B7CCE|nr:hypothetical protein [Candidatus Chloroploca sp. Khr17]